MTAPERIWIDDYEWHDEPLENEWPEYLRADLVPQWVSCSERMPELGERVWVTDGEQVLTDHTSRVRKGRLLLPSDNGPHEVIFYHYTNITHWHPIQKPLPPPPKDTK